MGLMVSLFKKETSGTISYKNEKYFLEFDVKHSKYDFGKMPFSYHKEATEKHKCITIWIPIRIGCEGWRIILKKKLA